MAWTDLEIANMALVRMGIHKQLTTLPDTSSEGKALAVLLPKVKERVLSAYPWSWALRHVALVAAAEAPTTLPFGWTHAYDKPADMLRPVRLWDGTRRFPLEDTLPFQVAPVLVGETLASALLTDASDAELIYITNGWLAATPTVTPPSCIDDVVAWLLAAELAMPLAKRPDLSGALAKTAAAELRRAIALDRGTVAQDPSPIPYNLRARG